METLTQLPLSVRRLIDDIESLEHPRPASLVNVLKNSRITEEDLQPWTDYAHPPGDSYGRKPVHKSDHYEIMVMSWNPGDFSAIHDHGYTQWGAVKIFGNAEHATFRVDDGNISTLARWQVKKGETLGVSHSLIHQMGNATDTPFISLHVYGDYQSHENITGDASIYDPSAQAIQRVNGGVFFCLPDSKILRREKGPKGDFPTTLRHQVEEIKRKRKYERPRQSDFEACFSLDKKEDLLAFISDIIDQETNKYSNSIQWKILNSELKAAAKLQDQLFTKTSEEDRFHKYAEVYDELIGKPCISDFIGPYLRFFFSNYGIKNKEIISIGCGTGLTEQFMIETLDVPGDHVYGMDISPAMVREARQRIDADTGDVLDLDPTVKKWDIAYAGLNVFQYLSSENLQNAIKATSGILKEGGYFVGDFITPDHIRWYPNIMYAENSNVVSFRTAKLVETGGLMYQESDIVNVSFLGKKMDVHYAGSHKRYLPPMNRVRAYFLKHFGSEVKLFDAVSLKPVSEEADSCPSTRYLVIARKSLS